MRRDPATDWPGLALGAGVGALIGAAVVVIGHFVYLDIAPVPAVLVCALLGAARWLAVRLEEPMAGPPWEQPQPPTPQSRSDVDVATSRVASMLSHAQPGRDFASARLAETLAVLASKRLGRRLRIAPDDALDHADGVLSPQLLAHLRSDRPPALRRSTLRAHLKEIDEL